ncbi:type II CAAX endopeptidase family protein [Estrella lausannensis]|uniref:Protease n=1 Tax=Estrella lausannensis TaxID=483423 RepID=A0A0H5DR70_9BACT|nr:type II CAAX endopeptidase family protein [Estrella lausannensis]CRX38144.1 Protease [Estrella lausannensis]
MNEAQENLSVESFLILLALVFFTAVFAKRIGYYSYPEKSVRSTPFVSVFQFLIAFILFFSVTLAASLSGGAIIQKTAHLLHIPLDGYAIRLLNGLLMVYGVTLALFLFARRNLFPKQSFFSPAVMVKGALSWFIAYPQMLLITIGLNYLLMELFHLEPEEQTSVLELKGAKSHPPLFFLMMFTITLIVPVCEEILFRGYLQNFLRRFLPRFPAIAITSLVFALFHFSGSQSAGNFVILPSLFFFSLYLGFVYEKWGSLSASYGLHAFFNGVSSLMIGSST